MVFWISTSLGIKSRGCSGAYVLLRLERSLSNHFSAPEQDVIRGSRLSYYTPSHLFVTVFTIPEPYELANSGWLSCYSVWGSNPRNLKCWLALLAQTTPSWGYINPIVEACPFLHQLPLRIQTHKEISWFHSTSQQPQCNSHTVWPCFALPLASYQPPSLSPTLQSMRWVWQLPIVIIAWSPSFKHWHFGLHRWPSLLPGVNGTMGAPLARSPKRFLRTTGKP